jgi:hypothetical protein
MSQCLAGGAEGNAWMTIITASSRSRFEAVTFPSEPDLLRYDNRIGPLNFVEACFNDLVLLSTCGGIVLPFWTVHL